jgi:hypothetical protein
MSHVVLLGDSIFDNALYVPRGPPVIEQVRRGLPDGWVATLLAVDGHTVGDVATQVHRVPADATHLILSAGGNDALGARGLLGQPAATVGDALAMLAEAIGEFRISYRATLGRLLERRLPTAVCTIYDAIPPLEAAERAALCGFDDVITRAAGAAGLPLIDLRLICSHPHDFSAVSPIEPSVVGGAKIAEVICRVMAGHDFAGGKTTVWV